MTLKDILALLREPIDSKLIKTKKKTSKKTGKTASIDYISWTSYCDLLDERCGLGGWSWEVQDINQVSNRLTLIGKLTIYGSDRHLSMMATGTEDLDCSSYGDPSSNAEAMALRRCCAKFGLSRELWADQPLTNSNNFTKTVNRNPKLSKGEITREQWLALKAAKEQDQSDYDPYEDDMSWHEGNPAYYGDSN